MAVNWCTMILGKWSGMPQGHRSMVNLTDFLRLYLCPHRLDYTLRHACPAALKMYRQVGCIQAAGSSLWLSGPRAQVTRAEWSSRDWTEWNGGNPVRKQMGIADVEHWLLQCLHFFVQRSHPEGGICTIPSFFCYSYSLLYSYSDSWFELWISGTCFSQQTYTENVGSFDVCIRY